MNDRFLSTSNILVDRSISVGIEGIDGHGLEHGHGTIISQLHVAVEARPLHVDETIRFVHFDDMLLKARLQLPGQEY